MQPCGGVLQDDADTCGAKNVPTRASRTNVTGTPELFDCLPSWQYARSAAIIWEIAAKRVLSTATDGGP